MTDEVATVDPGALLTPDDIAARLRVSRSMIYTLIKRGELAAIYVGRLPRVSEAAYAEYVGRLERDASRAVASVARSRKR